MTKPSSLLPDDLPLNAGQKQWLDGFMTGLEHACSILQETRQENGDLKPLYILYGSQTGNAEALAYRCGELAQQYAMAAKVCDMSSITAEDLPKMERLLLITSTYGEGEMPDNAQVLWTEIAADGAPKLDNIYYAVLALGDSGYDDFCEAGKLWDARLAALGGQRISARTDCDTDYETPAEQWFATVLPVISGKGTQTKQSGVLPAASPAKASAARTSPYNRNNPFAARLKHKRLLSGAASGKQIFHYEIDLTDSGEHYDAGDVLHVFPVNRPALVAELLTLLQAEADTQVSWQGKTYPLGELLRDKTEIRVPSRDFLAAFVPATGDASLQTLFTQRERSGWEAFIYGKDMVDLLRAYPQVTFTPQTFTDTLKPLSARAYSISSSIHKHPGEVHITVGAVRYQLADRTHHGTASTWLADMLAEGDELRGYFMPNKNFSIPEHGDTAMIMVGPGTGIAPFRAFLQEREALGACGDNWLFFGDRTRQDDFIYETELQLMQESGLLTRLDLAFSREQAEKIYVQDKMREHGAALFQWLERGAHFYVCGDASRMAKDVDKALHEIVAAHGNMDSEGAEQYINALKKAKRYVRDVY